MGILNVTPDSFSDGGAHNSVEKAIKHGISMFEDGASIIDVGGESSRPGSLPVSEALELERVLPVIRGLSDSIDAEISIDTCKPGVAKKAIRSGATMINDITGLGPEMSKVAADHGVSAVMMHMRGMPSSMQDDVSYEDVVAEIRDYFIKRISLARDAGVEDIIVDPGIGFGKRLEHNLSLISRIGDFRDLGCPVLIGPSRKSFIGEMLGLKVDERIDASIAAAAICVLKGADIVRVHDVRQCLGAIRIAQAIREIDG